MRKCHYCKDALIPEYDEDGTPINFWTDKEGNKY